MQTKQDHQHCVEEVVAKEGRVIENRVNPSTVDQPKTQAYQKCKNLLHTGSNAFIGNLLEYECTKTNIVHWLLFT